jgi:hypothetical protein
VLGRVRQARYLYGFGAVCGALAGVGQSKRDQYALVLPVGLRREGCRAVLARYDAFEEICNAEDAL